MRLTERIACERRIREIQLDIRERNSGLTQDLVPLMTARECNQLRAAWGFFNRLRMGVKGR